MPSGAWFPDFESTLLTNTSTIKQRQAVCYKVVEPEDPDISNDSEVSWLDASDELVMTRGINLENADLLDMLASDITPKQLPETEDLEVEAQGSDEEGWGAWGWNTQ
ncbi:hypothetical protein B0H21DRAFT_710408 [Amylocystis lapponica]|nr:hypothetical protein B0H21DRAFT_710408 [Amylocystis lapponica]